MGYNYYIASLHLAAKYALASLVLRVEHTSWPFKVPQTLVHTGGFHHTTIERYVAKQHGQSAVFCIGMFHVANATCGAVGIKRRPLTVLHTHFGGKLAARRTTIYACSLGINLGACYAVMFNVLAQCDAIDTMCCQVEQIALGQFAQYAKHTTSAVTLLHRVALRVGRQFTKAWHMTAQLVNVLHLEVDTGLIGHSQQVEHGVGRAAHGYIHVMALRKAWRVAIERGSTEVSPSP